MVPTPVGQDTAGRCRLRILSANLPWGAKIHSGFLFLYVSVHPLATSRIEASHGRQSGVLILVLQEFAHSSVGYTIVANDCQILNILLTRASMRISGVPQAMGAADHNAGAVQNNGMRPRQAVLILSIVLSLPFLPGILLRLTVFRQ